MKEIRPDVLGVISSFLDKKECFTSLDVYCLLGVRFNDIEYPIYEQVADAYRRGVMGRYLAEIAHIPLEHGGFANVWRYYNPVSDIKTFKISTKTNFVLDTKTLGHFPLLDINMEVKSLSDKVVLTPTTLSCDAEGTLVKNTNSDIIIPKELLDSSNLTSSELQVNIYNNRIEIINPC